MPRQPRINLPGFIHHIMVRGINGIEIFRDTKDYNRFIKRFGEILGKTQHSCFAWALMPNHVHLLVKSGNDSLSKLMSKVLTSHAVYFNRKHKRSGHLFQNRFKSILCQEDTYFLQLVRYIHLNPLRAGVLNSICELNKYPYTGHAYILGSLENDWQDTQYPLSWFRKQKRRCTARYLEYIKEGCEEKQRKDLIGGGLLRTVGGWKALKDLKEKGQSTLGDERILGDSEFVETALKGSKENSSAFSPSTRKPVSLERLTEDVCQYCGIKPHDLQSPFRNRSISLARSLICTISLHSLNLTGVEVARHLNVTKSAVSKMIVRFQPDSAAQEFMDNYFSNLGN